MQRKKRILIFNWWDIKNPKAGGAEVYLNEVFSRLTKRYEITLLCAKFPKSKPEEKINGINVIRRGPTWLINLTSVFWYLKNKDKFDLVLDFTNKIPYCTPLFVRSKPCIAIALDIFGEIFVKEFGFLGHILAIIERGFFLLYKKSCFISISKSTGQELFNLGVSYSNIKIINPGLSYTTYLPGPKQKEALIVYLGRLKKYKRVDLLLKVFKDIIRLIPKIRLVIIGIGNDKKRLEKLTQRLKLDSYVSFLGFLSEKEKAKWFQRAWVTVQPSIKEGWGLTVVEAAACGTPTIASNAPGLKDSILNEKTGWLFEKNNFNQLKNLIIEVLINKEKREKAGQEAIKFAKKFSWDQTARAVDKLIKNIEMRQKPLFKNRLQNLFIELTTACNFHCQMCDIWQTKKQSLSFNLVKKVLRQARNLGAEQVSFSGGEPLLYPNILNTLKMAKELGYQVFLTTNGSLIDSQTAPLITKYVDRIYISVDGNKEMHEKIRGPNSYENILRAIKLLKNKKILTNISMVVSKINYNQMKSVIDLASQEKIYQVSFQPFSKDYLFKRKNKHQYYWISGSDLKKLKKEIENTISYAHIKKVDIMSEGLLRSIPNYFLLNGKIYPKRFCQILKNSLIIQNNGKVFPCWGWDKIILGDIKNDSLKEIFLGKKRAEILKYTQQKNCPGCLLACSDVDYYMVPASGPIFIKKLNRLYRLFRLKGLAYVLKRVYQ